MKEINILPWVVVLTSLAILVVILTINTIHNNIIQKKEAMKQPINPKDEQLKQFFRLAYEAGQLAHKRKIEIDRMIDKGTKSFPKSPTFDDWYETVILGNGVHINDQSVPPSPEHEYFLRQLMNIGYYHR